MTSHPLTARDVPELCQDIVDWYGSPGSRHMVRQMLDGRGAGALADVQDGAAMLARRKASVRAAEMYYITADMTDLALQIGAGLGEWFTTDETPEEDHGVVVWGKPIVQEGEPEALAPVAAAWGRTGGRFTVDTYGYAPALDQHAQRSGLVAKGLKPYIDAMRAGRLTWLGSVDTREGEDVSGMRGVLLATWLLIRQPSDERKAIHEVEHVSASRASQKRIARSAGDPTRQVRYVTLRKTLRPAPDGADGEGHASRVYRHRWFVKPHRRTYPDSSDPTGHSRKWVGPYIVIPKGCEGAPILGGERVNVLRR